MLVNPTPALVRFMKNELPTLIAGVFRVFEDDSDGNFNHFGAFLLHLLRLYPNAVLAAVTESNYLLDMLPYVHVPVVSTSIVYLLTTAGSGGAQHKLYAQFVARGGIDALHRMLLGLDDVADIEPAAEFLTRCTSALSAEEPAELLWSSIAQQAGLIPGIVAIIAGLHPEELDFARLASLGADLGPDYPSESPSPASHAYPLFARRALANVLTALLQGSMRVMTAPPSMMALMGMENGMDAPPPVSRMACMLHSLCTQLVAHVPELERGFVTTPLGPPRRHTAYTVPATFSELHMDLIQILADLVSTVPELVLDKFTPAFWRTSGFHFLTHPHNNMYHLRFFKLLSGTLSSSYYVEETLEALLTAPIVLEPAGPDGAAAKERLFLDALIWHYLNQRNSAARGFIILILNMIRLFADAQPADAFLPQLLAASKPYLSFLPQLLDTTKLYTHRAFPSIARVAPHVYPGVSPSTVTYTSDGIDLGSSFASILKLGKATPHPERAIFSPPPS